MIANAAEHGVGPVEVRGQGGLARLELVNRNRPDGGGQGDARGRGRGLVIAKRAAGELGGRVTVEREGELTRTIVELPTRRRAA